MHEQSLMADLLRRVDVVAQQHGAAKVRTVRVRVGALAHISAEHLREHFAAAAAGTVASTARLEVTAGSDADDAHAQEVLLESVEIEVADA